MDIEVIERDTYHVTIKKTDYNRLLALANEPTNNLMRNIIKNYEEQHKADKEFRELVYKELSKTNIKYEQLLKLDIMKDEVIKNLKSVKELYESEWYIVTFFRKLFHGTKNIKNNE